MTISSRIASALATSVCVVAIAMPAQAQARQYNVPAGSLKSALDAYARQSGRQVIYKSDDVRGVSSPGVRGNLSEDAALRALLEGTGFAARSDSSGAVAVVRQGNGSAGDQVVGQTTDSQASEEGEGEIVVTGTHIRGVNPTSPLHVVTREDIEQSGYGTVGEIIRSLPENFNGGQNPGVMAAGALNANSANGSTVNLRGLGSDATLVLVNGRRLAANAIGQAPDISMLPLPAIERVEVVTDGSSAIYGSDAVAGVVNFILRKNYRGFEGSVRVGGATRGGGFEQTYSALAGLTGERWHVLLNLQHSKQEAILASERNFASAAVQNTDLFRPQTQTSALLTASYDIGDRVSLSLDAIWSDLDSSYRQQLFSTSTAFSVTNDSPSYSVTAGLAVDIPGGWDARLSLGTSGGIIHTVTTSTTSSVTRTRNDTSYAEVVANGPLVRLPSGDLMVAIGAGGRKLSYRRTTSSVVAGSDDAVYFFGEALLPVVRPSDRRGGLNALELSLSGRFEKYSDFGSTATPRLGIRYVPLPGITLRGTWGKSFKTPSFQQYAGSRSLVVFQAATFGYSGTGLTLLAQGSNPDLAPEKSTSWTAGIEYSPASMPSLKVGATYFDVDYRDRVAMPIAPATTAFSNPAFASFLLWNPSAQYQAALVADANTFANQSGTTYDPSRVVAVILNRNTNVTSQTVRGVDVFYRQSFDIGASQISAFANATWVMLDQQTIPTTPAVRRSGTLNNVPDFRARAGLTWRAGNFAATGAVNHTSKLLDNGIVPNRAIDPWTVFDLNLSYELPPEAGGVAMALSVQNLFDRAPPFAESPGRLQQGITWDTTNASAMGRFVAVTIKKRF